MSHSTFRPVLWHQPFLWIVILWALTLLLLFNLGAFTPQLIIACIG